MPTKRKLTPGQAVLRDLALEIGHKLVRLRSQARSVAGDPTPGRNLTALRNTAGELLELLKAIRERRCWVCACTEYDCRQCVEKTGECCTWVGKDLCSACQVEADHA